MDSISLASSATSAGPTVALARATGGPAPASAGPRDLTTWSKAGPLPSSFDVVGRTRELASSGGLHSAAPGGLPNAFPTGSVALASYLQAEFPGAVIPQDTDDLDTLSQKLSGSTGLSHADVLNMVQDAVAEEQQSNDEDDEDEGINDSETAADQQEEVDSLVPITVDAAGFKDGTDNVSVANMEIVAADDPEDYVATTEGGSSGALRMEGRQDAAYDVDVEWADGTFSSTECLAEDAVFMNFDAANS